MSSEEASNFATWDQSITIQGDLVSRSEMSSLHRVHVGGKVYYVKRYEMRGRHLRRFLGRSRIRAEWENLQYFQSLGIPTARLVAFGEENYPGWLRKGVMITQEVENSQDLASLIARQDIRFKNKKWLKQVIRKLSSQVRSLHDEHFIHGDLKWRNILVSNGDAPEIYLIDCPMGRKFPFPFRERGIIKDLACLDKLAKYHLSKRDRLSFYLLYEGKIRLGVEDKRRIRKILRFFDGRE